MRELKTRDVFAMSRIITKMNVKDDIKALAERVQKGETIDQTSAGVELILTVLEGASTKETEKMIYEFLGDVLEKTPKEIADSDPIALIKELQEAADWRAFFANVVRIITKNY